MVEQKKKKQEYHRGFAKIPLGIHKEIQPFLKAKSRRGYIVNQRSWNSVVNEALEIWLEEPRELAKLDEYEREQKEKEIEDYSGYSRVRIETYRKIKPFLKEQEWRSIMIVALELWLEEQEKK